MSTESSPRPHTELPEGRELVLKVIPMPADTNGNGDIFGGWVMAQVDLAGAVLPARYVRGRMATVAVNPSPVPLAQFGLQVLMFSTPWPAARFFVQEL